MSYSRSAEVNIIFPSENIAKIVFSSLSPEVGAEIQRTKVKVQKDGKKLILVINAEDTSALRAALNSYLRWIDVALRASLCATK